MSEANTNSAIDFSRLRIEYMQHSLDEQDVASEPVRQFTAWFNEALQAGAHEPNAMTLATSTADGRPSARIVLLKGVDERGFVFFTNYASRKGREIEANPWAALVFYWPELERQIRVEGKIGRTSAEESDAYFNSRPVDARFGSAASPQSQPIASRELLEAREQALRNAYPDGSVPRPEHWGGYRLEPARAEFWQGRPSRLHDRIEYVKEAGAEWIRRRIAP